MLANLTAAVPAAVALVGGWDNVLSVGIKTSRSILLPVWNAPLQGRFKDAEAADEDMEEDKPAPKKAAAKAATKAAAKPAKADKPKEKTAKAAVTLGDKKKSSTIGSGAKKAKAAAVGTGKTKTKPKAK